MITRNGILDIGNIKYTIFSIVITTSVIDHRLAACRPKGDA